MFLFDNILIVFISFSFLYFGFSCLSSKFMIAEFQRYGLSVKQRKATGYLQLIGALGLIAGFFFTIIGVVSAFGLALLMLMGFLVRLKIKDSFLQSLPSFVFIVLNLYVGLKLLDVSIF